MKAFNIHEAKTQLSRLVERAAVGEEIIIAKAGKPMAKLGPLAKTKGVRLGVLKGAIWISDDFDAPLPDDLIESLYGEVGESEISP